MKLVKWLSFILILPIVFLMLYYNSDKKGFQRAWVSFRIAVVIATSLASLSWQASETNNPSFSQSQLAQERVNFNQEFNKLNTNDREIRLVKTDLTPNGFRTMGSQPKRPGTGINPYRIAPKLIHRGFGAAGAGGAGNGGGNPNLDNYDLIPKKKQQFVEQFEVNENVAEIKIITRIHENFWLERQAKKTMRNPKAANDILHLTEQLRVGNIKPRTGPIKVQGCQNVFEARGKHGGRIYFRQTDGKIEILAISDKDNQNKVSNLLRASNY